MTPSPYCARRRSASSRVSHSSLNTSSVKPNHHLNGWMGGGDAMASAAAGISPTPMPTKGSAAAPARNLRRVAPLMGILLLAYRSWSFRPPHHTPACSRIFFAAARPLRIRSARRQCGKACCSTCREIIFFFPARMSLELFADAVAYKRCGDFGEGVEVDHAGTLNPASFLCPPPPKLLATSLTSSRESSERSE